MQKPGISFVRSPAAVLFRNIAGDANRHMNTLLVGLHTIQQLEPVVPDDLVVPWTTSSIESDWSSARNFIYGTVMMTMVDGLNQYINVIVQIDGLVAPEELAKIRGDWLHALQRRSTMGERVSYLAGAFPDFVKQEHVAIVHLLAVWRNRTVHSSYEFDIPEAVRETLERGANYFLHEHGGACIAAILQDFDANRLPSLSALSTMIASTHRLTESIDQSVVMKLDPQGYCRSVVRYIVRQKSSQIEAIETLWEHGGIRTVGQIYSLLLKHGAVQSPYAPQWAPSLTWNQLMQVLPLGLNEARKFFEQ